MPTPIRLSPGLDGMRPIRVTAVLAGKLMGHDLPRLDAILEYRAAQECGRDVRCPPADLKPNSVNIPLEKSMANGFAWPIPHCSDAIVGTCHTDSHQFFAKRFPSERSALMHPSRRLVINTTGGPFKSYMLPVRARQFQRIAWFCFGDARRVAELVAGVFVLGKKRLVGGAIVTGWEIEPAAEDLSWFAPSPEGTVLMRTLPMTYDPERPDRIPESFRISVCCASVVSIFAICSLWSTMRSIPHPPMPSTSVINIARTACNAFLDEISGMIHLLNIPE